MEYDAAQVKRMNATYMMISKALKRGALSPRSAVSWAARAGRGEDVSVVASLARSEWRAAENRKVAARSNSQLAQQILDLLGQAVDGAPGPDDEFAAIFPPNDMPRTTLIYDQNDDGSRPAARAVPAATMPPGYQYGTTSNVHQAYASGRYEGRPGTLGQLGELDDEHADSLFP